MNNVKGAVIGWDVTIPNKDNTYSIDDIQKYCRKWAKKWVFQVEAYKDGSKHYQIRLHLKVKRNGSALLNVLKTEDALIGNWTVTTKGVHLNNNFNYVMKPERISGPYSDKDKRMTWQLKEFMNKGIHYPYHQQILKEIKRKEWRTIDLIYCPQGSKSKTIFCEYLEYNNLAVDIPPYRQMEDLMAWGLCEIDNDDVTDWYDDPKAFVFDMPRGMKKDKLGEFYAGIESFKDGRFYDKRYSARKEQIGRPRIYIFTNTLPVFELMSIDRWNIWELDGDLTLKKYDINEPCLISEDIDRID
jgi:hypothetical protein